MDALLALGFGEAGVSDILPMIAVLLAMTAVLGGLGSYRLRSQLAR